MSDLDKLGWWSKEDTLYTEGKGENSAESMTGQRYNSNWLLHYPSSNVQPWGEMSGENGHEQLGENSPRQLQISLMSIMLCACLRTIREIHP